MPTPIEIIESLRAVNDADSSVLLKMAELGADLRKPHLPDFAFETLNESSAEAIADALVELGFDVEIYPPDDSNQNFQVVGKKEMTLSHQSVAGLSSTFEKLALKHKAVYDGWGAEIVE